MFNLKDVNDNDVEISKEEITNLITELRLENPHYLEGHDFYGLDTDGFKI